MTAARALPRNEDCALHHVPRSECPPWSKHGHTLRLRDDAWNDALDTAGTDNLTPWVAEVMEARLGYVRCRRCDDRAPAVPLIPGDLTGGTLDEWISRAERRVRSQHPRHESVRLGAEPSVPAPVVFMPPMPAAVPDHSRTTGKARS